MSELQESSDHSESETGTLVVLFLIVGSLTGTLFRLVCKKFKLPFTPILLVCGILLGILKNFLGEIGKSAEIVEKMSPHLLLLVFIPPLIFESVYNCSWHIFKKSIVSILILAFPGILWSSFLIALTFKMVLFYSNTDLSFIEALTLGCILSPTDPVATIALLKEIGSNARFNTLLEGESLFNDGSSIVLFMVLLSILNGESTSMTGITFDFVKTSFGGPLLGLIFGILICFLLKKISQDKVLITTVTIIGVYACFYASEFTAIKVSGILSLVILGIYLNAVAKRKLSIEAEECLHNVWSVIQHIFEVLIFFVSGVVVGVEIIHESTIVFNDWMKMFIFWILIILIRGIAIFTFYPILKRSSYGITLKEIILLSYGGTRGAICLCLALMVNYNSSLNERFRELTIFYACGITVLTVIINGSTCKRLIEYAEMFKPSEVKKKFLQKCIKEVLVSTNEKLEELKNEPSVAYAEWRNVKKIACCNKLGNVNNEEIEKIHVGEELKSFEKEELIEEIRFKVIGYLNKFFWKMYKTGELSESSITLLSTNTNIINDMPSEKLHYFELLSSNFTMDSMRLYLKFKDNFLIGPFCKNMIINKLYDAYETTNAFIEACEEAIQIFESCFPKSAEMTEVLKEIEDNMEQAIMYITSLDHNYSEISRSVHTVKASVTLLRHKKHKLEEIHEQGFIDESEFEELKEEIESNIMAVQEGNFDTSGIRFNEVLTDCPIFSSLPAHEIVSILLKSNEKVYNKNEVISRYDRKIENVYFVIYGSVREQFDDFCFIKGIGSIIDPYAFICKEPSKAIVKSVYNSKLMEINGETIQNMLEKYPKFRSQWIKNAFLYCLKMSKNMNQENCITALSSREKRKIIESSTVLEISPQQQFSSAFGCFLFEGEALGNDGKVYTRHGFIANEIVLKAKIQSTVILFPETNWKQIEEDRSSLIESFISQ